MKTRAPPRARLAAHVCVVRAGLRAAGGVDGGLCAVRVPAGQAELRLDHFTFGLDQSLAAAGVSAVLYAGYLVWHRRRKARRAWAKRAPETTIYRKEN